MLRPLHSLYNYKYLYKTEIYSNPGDNITNKEYQKELEDLFKRRNQLPGKDLETGAPIVVNSTVQKGVGTVSIETFCNLMDEHGVKFNTKTLSFVKLKTTATAKEKPTEKAEDIPGLKKLDTYTKAELESMEWSDIRSVAKADPDIPGNKTKDWLIENLTGRPKFPLEE